MAKQADESFTHKNQFPELKGGRVGCEEREVEKEISSEWEDERREIGRKVEKLREN